MLNIFWLVSRYDVVTYIDASFVQMSLWESELCEKLIVDGEKKKKTPLYKPRGLRWSGVKAIDKKSLSGIIDVEKSYIF